MILPGNIFLKKADVERLADWKNWSLGIYLVLTNVLVFVFFCVPDLLKDRDTKIFKGITSTQVENLNKMYVQTLDPLHVGSRPSIKVTTPQVFRDRSFWLQAQRFPFQGDQVQIEKNKQLLQDLDSMYTVSSQYRFGLSQNPTTPWAWITYQFVHAGFFHLLTNMFFLFLVTQFLRKRVSTNWILAVYILGGIGAGISFLALTSEHSTAMVGASGAVCALIAFLAVVENRRVMPWSYFISPMQRGYGLIYLPAFLLFPVYLLSDFTTILFNADGVSQSVAHSAHIGGALTGVTLAISYLLDQKLKKHLLKNWGSSLSQREVIHLRGDDRLAEPDFSGQDKSA